MEDILSLTWAGKTENWYNGLPRLDSEIANRYGSFAEYLKKTQKEGLYVFKCDYFSPFILSGPYSKPPGYVTCSLLILPPYTALRGGVLIFCFAWLFLFCFNAKLSISPLPSAPERQVLLSYSISSWLLSYSISSRLFLWFPIYLLSIVFVGSGHYNKYETG